MERVGGCDVVEDDDGCDDWGALTLRREDEDVNVSHGEMFCEFNIVIEEAVVVSIEIG